MSFIAAAIVGGSTLVSGILGSNAANSAARTQADAANRASDLQYKQWQESTALQEPWRKAGEQALNKLAPLMDYQKFGSDQFQADPGYAFRLSEGQKALDRQAAARGGLMSGAALKGAQRFGQEMGSQEYNNAFNRYQAERAAQLQPLQSMASLGQSTAQQVGNSGQLMAQNVGDMMTSGAAARASGYVGSANALTNALGTGINYYQNQQMLNKFPAYGGGAPQSYGNLNQQYYTGNSGMGD